jgi:hypothetical protein
MKTLRVLSIAVLSLVSTLAVAQSPAQKSFDEMKGLAGEWEGKLNTVPADPKFAGVPARVSLRVTSMGNAMMHEMQVQGRKDDPITMFYLDNDRLLLTHYCDAGNRPRMMGKLLPDGKTVEFEFLDIAGADVPEHMHHARFMAVDADHHMEEWTFMLGDKPVLVRVDLHRKN